MNEYRFAAIECDLPDTVSHGTFRLLENHTRMGAVAEYSCPARYKLIGSSIRHCTAVGKWIPEPPLCVDMESLKSVILRGDETPTVRSVEGNLVATAASNSNDSSIHLMTGFIATVVVLVAIVAVLVFWVYRSELYNYIYFYLLFIYLFVLI